MGVYFDAEGSGVVMWNTDFDWPFKTPPTREFLRSQGLDVDNWHLLALNESPFAPSDKTCLLYTSPSPRDS